MKNISLVDIMNSCEFTTMITAVACCIANGRCPEEIEVLAAMFTQLGDTLATMTAYDACYCKDEDVDVDNSLILSNDNEAAQ